MRTITASVALIMMMAGVASADVEVAGTYDVKFEEVSTNCQAPLKYPHGKILVAQKGNQVSVDIGRTPLMTGVPGKRGKISAKSRSGNTMIDGMQGVFSVAGKVTPEGQMHLVMVGEFTAAGKALCTQSWNLVGPRTAAAPKKP